MGTEAEKMHSSVAMGSRSWLGKRSDRIVDLIPANTFQVNQEMSCIDRPLGLDHLPKLSISFLRRHNGNLFAFNQESTIHPEMANVLLTIPMSPITSSQICIGMA